MGQSALSDNAQEIPGRETQFLGFVRILARTGVCLGHQASGKTGVLHGPKRLLCGRSVFASADKRRGQSNETHQTEHDKLTG